MIHKIILITKKVRRFNNNRPSGRSSSSFDRRSKPVSMHSATCDACGKDCQVPFRPSGDKPIYCSNCFEKQGDRNSDRRSSRNFNDRGDMYDAVCDDCGRDCRVPFRPSSDKPIYCSKCFENRGNTHDREAPKNNIQNDMLENISSKLDRILAILESKE